MIFQKKEYLFLKIFPIGKIFKKGVLFFQRSLFCEIKILKLYDNNNVCKFDAIPIISPMKNGHRRHIAKLELQIVLICKCKCSLQWLWLWHCFWLLWVRGSSVVVDNEPVFSILATSVHLFYQYHPHWATPVLLWLILLWTNQPPLTLHCFLCAPDTLTTLNEKFIVPSLLDSRTSHILSLQ